MAFLENEKELVVFLSHNINDKPVVEPIALKLRSIYGQHAVFYDSWTIQPGDGLIDKMNMGLEQCHFFFFFVSENSLRSNMVSLEWQNALYKAVKGTIKFIPVRISDCMMPAILLQSVYIDYVNYGPEVAFRQINDIIQGKNIFRESFTGYSRCQVRKRTRHQGKEGFSENRFQFSRR